MRFYICLLLLILIPFLLFGQVVNEFQAAPESPEPEWIELYNNSDESLQINNWQICDLNSCDDITQLVLLPGEYILLTKDSSQLKSKYNINDEIRIFELNIPALNNTSDAIVIKNDNSTIDSIYYDMSDFSKAISIERIDPNLAGLGSNLSNSIHEAGATPGFKNSISSKIEVNYNILINEFMFDISDSQAEYVELYNNSASNINLNSIRIFDAAAEFEKAVVIESQLVLEPYTYGIIAWDSLLYSQFPYLLDSSNVYISQRSINLNSTGDDLIISDSFGNIIDSISYLDDWHHKDLDETKGISLEKINPILDSKVGENWSSSADAFGGTPGRRNSINSELNEEAEISASPNPFRPISRNEFCVISFEIPFTQSALHAKIFDQSGLLVRELSNNQFSGSKGRLVWDGRNKNESQLPVGAYVLIIEAADYNSDKIETAKIMLVIAK